MFICTYVNTADAYEYGTSFIFVFSFLVVFYNVYFMSYQLDKQPLGGMSDPLPTFHKVLFLERLTSQNVKSSSLNML